MAAQKMFAPAAIATLKPVPYQDMSVTVSALGTLKFFK